MSKSLDLVEFNKAKELQAVADDTIENDEECSIESSLGWTPEKGIKITLFNEGVGTWKAILRKGTFRWVLDDYEENFLREGQGLPSVFEYLKILNKENK